MTALIIVSLSVLVLYLLYKFGRYVVGIYLILCGVFLLSFPIMFFDLDLGVMILVYSTISIVAVFLLVAISGSVGLLISGFIIAPMSIMWMGLKGLIINK